MTLLFVPDMSCGHCKASVEAALTALPGTTAAVDLTQRQVQVSGNASPATLLDVLTKIGFPAQIIAAT